MVAPSDMMDGRVRAIRDALDDVGSESVPVLAYSAKYASAFYGPFREAADSTPSFGDRRGYQMDPANVREALRECELDIEEGADAIMIKPALPYLDVIRAARESFDVPIGAYNVSGEYAMVKAAAQAGWLDERQAALESLTAIKRAGADLIVSYWTKDARAVALTDTQRALPPRARADPRRRQLARARDARRRARRAVLRRARRGRIPRRRRRQPLPRLGAVVGAAPLRARGPGDGRGGARGGAARHDLRRADRGRGRARGGDRRRGARRSRRCGSSRRAPRPR